MGIESVIAKIQKLRALSRSTNANEAAAAAAAADRLIHEHRLSEAELEAKGEGGEAPDDGGSLFSERRKTAWQWELARVLSKHYDVAAWSERERATGLATYRMVGRASDVATVRYMFHWLSSEVRSLREREPGYYRASFALGVVVGISVTLERLASERRQPGRGHETGGAIVLASRLDAAKAKRTEIAGELRKARRSDGPSDRDAIARGILAGREIDIAGGGSPRLGEGAPALDG